ncbi:uncharacterized protein LOC143284098 [Babylonia areolata]|uniref:uncharacterized protein LOC143284098 n=1 Tax=Babylonia areolata TaxID=304850 RepID=UPI003FD2B477
MKRSSCDDFGTDRISKRRQQKRDYATRKRKRDKEELHHLLKTNKRLSHRSKRKKRQIQKLSAWAMYAQSFLSLCCQMVTLRPPGQPTVPASLDDGPLLQQHGDDRPSPGWTKGSAAPPSRHCLDPCSSTASQSPEQESPPLPDESEELNSTVDPGILTSASSHLSSPGDQQSVQMTMQNPLERCAHSSYLTTEAVTSSVPCPLLLLLPCLSECACSETTVTDHSAGEEGVCSDHYLTDSGLGPLLMFDMDGVVAEDGFQLDDFATRPNLTELLT